MLDTYLDYTGRLTPDQIRAGGASGVCRYLSWLPNPKVILKPEYDMLISGGIDVICNWEFDAFDWLSGAAGAQMHATEAVRQLKALGYPAGHPVPGSCDFNISRTQWADFGLGYARTYSAIIADAGYMPGVYGPGSVLSWCQNDVPAMKFFWQAGMSWGWLMNNSDWPDAHLIQRRQRTVSGVDTDINDLMKGFLMSDWPNQRQLPPPTQFPFDGEVASVDTQCVLRTGMQTGWSTGDGQGWWIVDRLEKAANRSVTLSAQDKQDIINGVTAGLAEAVFNRFKDQMNK